jgi:hypothetical protein
VSPTDAAIVFGVMAVPCVATYRVFEINRHLKNGFIVSRKGIGAFRQLLADLSYWLLVASVALFWLVAAGTLFLMKDGSASGVPFGLVAVVLPIIWFIVEILLSAAYTRASARDKRP